MKNRPQRTEPHLERSLGIIRNGERWREFHARLETVRAYNDKLPEETREYRMCERATVSARREFVVDEHQIPYGSLGVVLAERHGGILYDVEFYCAPNVTITVCGFHLQMVH
jgi:hypothetical protein